MVEPTKVVTYFIQISILSFIKLLIVQNNYRTLVVYREPILLSNLTDWILETAANSNIPEMVFTFQYGQKNDTKFRKYRNEPFLNLLIINDLSNIQKIENIDENILSNDHTVILVPTDDYEQFEKIIDRFVSNINVLDKVLFISSNLQLIKMNRYKEFDILQNLSSVVETDVKRLFKDDIDSYIRENDLIVFFKIIEPNTMVMPNEKNKIMIIGPDALIADEILKRFNARALIYSDIGLIDSDFTQFFTQETPFLKNLHYRFWHREMFTNVFLTSPNYR